MPCYDGGVIALLLLSCTPATEIDLGGGNDTGPAPADTAPENVDGAEDFGCRPEADDIEVDEGEVVSLPFACTGTGVASSWSLVDGPPGAALDDRTGELTWTTDLSSAGAWTIRVAAMGEGEELGEAVVNVVDAYDAPGNEGVSPGSYLTEYGLPVFHIELPPDINFDDSEPTTITYRGEAYEVEIQYRGAASSYYPKKSFRVKFPPDHEFKDEDEDFPKRRGIVLTSTFDDNAYFRQKMVYDLWNMQDEARAQIENMMVVVYLDGEYHGLYVLTDHISGEWWEDYGHNEDGSLYKSVDHSANFYSTYGGSTKSSWHSGYEKKEGIPNDYSDIDAFVQFVAESNDADFDAEIGEMIVLEEFYDWWSLVVFTESDDSGGKNAYLYNDPAAPLWHHAPWDFNHSLGQTWQTDREPATYDYDFTSANNLFKRLLDSRAYGSDMSARFDAQRDTVFHPDTTMALIDGYIERIDKSARRDWDKWQDDYYSYSGWSWRDNWTDYDGEVAYVRQWLQDRHEFVEDWNP